MGRPEDLRYTPTHEWLRLEGDLATVGITDHAVEQLGDLAFLDLPQPGAKLTKGQRFGEIESTKAVADLFSPVSGEVVEVNGEVVQNLDILKDSPFERGWLLRVRVSGTPELESLLSASEYAEKLAAEEH